MKNTRCAKACLLLMILVALCEFRAPRHVERWNPLARVLQAARTAAEGK